MPTNLALDDQLIEAVRRAGRFRTKREAVTAALEEYLQARRQRRLLRRFGTVEYVPGYDYKAARNR